MKRCIYLFSILITVFFSFSVIAAEPKTISAEKMQQLLPNERNTIEIFQKSSPKVVYVHRMKKLLKRSAIKRLPAGSGSGIIWDAKGHIVTNYHVVKGADEFLVTIGGMKVPAKVIGQEPRKDIAVLSINSPKALAYLKNYKPFESIYSKDLVVGQKTIAIGNPFGLDHSLTVGVISALDRKVLGVGGVIIHGMIQTDASVNPGNSGGPLLDSAGRLIGLNTMIYSRSGSSSGVGFVVPSSDIDVIVNQIIKHGRVQLAGIGIHHVDPKIAKKLGAKDGLAIGKVLPNTPAQQIGLKGIQKNKWGQMVLGDTIIALNGKSMTNYDSVYDYFSHVNVGDTVDLAILRDSKVIHFKIKTINIALYSA